MRYPQEMCLPPGWIACVSSDCGSLMWAQGIPMCTLDFYKTGHTASSVDIPPDNIPKSAFASPPLTHLLHRHHGPRKASLVPYQPHRHRGLHIRTSLRSLGHCPLFKQAVRGHSVVRHRVRGRERVAPDLDHVRRFSRHMVSLHVVSGRRPRRESPKSNDAHTGIYFHSTSSSKVMPHGQRRRRRPALRHHSNVRCRNPPPPLQRRLRQLPSASAGERFCF